MTPDAIDPQAFRALAFGKPGIRRPGENAAQRDRPREIRRIVEDDVVQRYGVKPVGRIAAVKERFYAISVERKITHPVVREVTLRAAAALSD